MIVDIDGMVKTFIAVAQKNRCKITSIYLSGSYANHYFLAGASDLDILLLVEDAPDNLAGQLLDAVGEQEIELDLCVLEESRIQRDPNSIDVRESVMSSKLCGQLVYGDDLLLGWELPPVEEYTKRTVEMVFEFIRRAHGGFCDREPLVYPDGDDPYKGYLVMRSGSQSTKQIISLYSWIATARLARYRGLYCGCKKQCQELSGQYLDDAFGRTFQLVYMDCRNNWKYRVPEDACGQGRLKDYCRLLLEFEKDFVEEFSEYI